MPITNKNIHYIRPYYPKNYITNESQRQISQAILNLKNDDINEIYRFSELTKDYISKNLPLPKNCSIITVPSHNKDCWSYALETLAENIGKNR